VTSVRTQTRPPSFGAIVGNENRAAVRKLVAERLARPGETRHAIRHIGFDVGNRLGNPDRPDEFRVRRADAEYLLRDAEELPEFRIDHEEPMLGVEQRETRPRSFRIAAAMRSIIVTPPIAVALCRITRNTIPAGPKTPRGRPRFRPLSMTLPAGTGEISESPVRAWLPFLPGNRNRSPCPLA